MPSDNALNQRKGSAFHRQAAVIVGKHLNSEFQLDYPILIGKPPKAPQHLSELIGGYLERINAAALVCEVIALTVVAWFLTPKGAKPL